MKILSTAIGLATAWLLVMVCAPPGAPGLSEVLREGSSASALTGLVEYASAALSGGHSYEYLTTTLGYGLMALAITLMIFVVAHSFKGFRPLFLLRLLRRLRARSMALPMAIGLAFAVPAVLWGQSGTAFRDFNGNGIQNGAEPGVEGVIVRLYANASSPTTDQFIGETVTGANGT